MTSNGAWEFDPFRIYTPADCQRGIEAAFMRIEEGVAKLATAEEAKLNAEALWEEARGDAYINGASHIDGHWAKMAWATIQPEVMRLRRERDKATIAYHRKLHEQQSAEKSLSGWQSNLKAVMAEYLASTGVNRP